MSRKLGKLLILTAAVSTAAAAAVYYMRKKAAEADICEEEPEEVEDITEEAASRSYVPLGRETAEEGCCSECEETSVIEECTEAPAEETIEKTEEFFGNDAE